MTVIRWYQRECCTPRFDCSREQYRASSMDLRPDVPGGTCVLTSQHRRADWLLRAPALNLAITRGSACKRRPALSNPLAGKLGEPGQGVTRRRPEQVAFAVGQTLLRFHHVVELRRFVEVSMP
jgi:hypothetical protein